MESKTGLAGFKPHANQLKVLRCKKRFRVVVAGRRFGKTLLACAEAITFSLIRPGSRVWYISPSYRQSKVIAWKMMINMIPKSSIKKTNLHDLEIQLKNGSELALKGGEDPPTLKGVGLDFVVLDENGDMKKEVWEEAIFPTLLDSGGHALFIGNPRGFNHFHVLAKRGDHNEIIEGQLDTKYEKDEDWQTFRFTSYDNPVLEKRLIDQMKTSLPPLRFQEEVMARFVVFSGMIYEEFSQDIHVIAPFEIPWGWRRYVGMDFGLKHPTAAVFVAVDGEDNWFVYDEYREGGKTTIHHAGVIRSKMEGHDIKATFGDPSAAQLIRDYQDQGIFVTPARKIRRGSRQGFVATGIEKIARRLKTLPGRDKPHSSIKKAEAYPTMFIFSTCPNLVKEFQTYRWHETLVGGEVIFTEKPVKLGDDLLDALRYFAVSFLEHRADKEGGPRRSWADRVKRANKWGIR